jgi:hypothetical protein
MKNSILLRLVLLSMLISSCSSTSIVSNWREPESKVNIKDLNKVLVVAMFRSETSRRNAEDKMVSYLKGKGVVSYNYLDSNFNKKDEVAIREKIRTDGFDGAVTMRIINVDKEKIYTPGQINYYPSFYRNFSGYYYNRWNYNATPGYYETSKTFTVETNVYSIKDDKIIWSSVTKTTNPDGIDKMAIEIAKIIYKQMTKQGFVIND